MSNIQNQIICPKCNSSFNLNENDYAYIRSQVKDSEIEQAVKKFKDLANAEKENAISLAKEQTKSEMQELITAGEKKIESLELERELAKEQEKIVVQNATSEKDKLIENLTNDLARANLLKKH